MNTKALIDWVKDNKLILAGSAAAAIGAAAVYIYYHEKSKPQSIDDGLLYR